MGNVALTFTTIREEAPILDGDVQVEEDIRIVEVEVGQFLDFVQSLSERVAVQVKTPGSFLSIMADVQVGF